MATSAIMWGSILDLDTGLVDDLQVDLVDQTRAALCSSLLQARRLALRESVALVIHS